MSQYYAVLDLGSRLFTMALHLFDDSGEEKIVYAAIESHGITNMTIDNNPQVVSRIRKLCTMLKTKTGVEVQEVHVAYIGGPIIVEDYECTVTCTGNSANHKLAVMEDIEKLQDAYLSYTTKEDLEIVDHMALQYRKDGQPCALADLEGVYAKNISCHFLLFLAESQHYQRFKIALEGAKLHCAGVYVGFRTCGLRLINKDERAQALALLDDSHIEVGFYENGVLTKYKWIEGGWDVIRENLLQEDRYLRPIDLDVTYLQTMNLTTFKSEWFEMNNNDDAKLKKVGGHLNATYIASVRNTLAEEWKVNLPLKYGGGLLLTGSISAINGIDFFFNTCLSRKLPEKELYKVKVAEHTKPEKWEACESQYAGVPLNLFSIPIGMLDLLRKQNVVRSKGADCVSKESLQSGEPIVEESANSQEQETKEGIFSRIWNSIIQWLNGDISSYDTDERDGKK